ncbi:acetyltransferase [Enterococcus thailandicus]|uniref:Acetyltransferase n=2 Tax=Enterococcus TaxID=1350 RepID=A0A1L8XP96_ENTTH|nr:MULTISPECIES: GNAT family N-acetyltransferase [Enterococcus]MDG3374667.1 GNAT family N-acetyltransferase [Vibrio parahaemolyticus]ASZ06548.1 N-acetyltransferase [Enterococcus thailandicus]MBO0482805.1 GNAT family N-acetyltransferase [Enterococcus sp. MSG2901]MDA3964637.1 GNAT family N-acetyltransferase [Enterococcus thailandicus]MDA3974153.1 GNAT family N-acetyltransferase [Enterococcus thailandicus]
MLEKKRVTTEEELDQLLPIIHDVWQEAFVPIIGQAQVDYMLATYQSKEQIQKELGNDVYYFLLIKDDQPVGYTAYEKFESSIYLSKLYLLASVRGQGLTSAVFDWYEELAKKEKVSEIFLRVNQDNLHAIDVYKHQGFQLEEELISDIGEGFQMVDYKMKKELA